MRPIDAQSRQEIEQLTSRVADYFLNNFDQVPQVATYLAEEANDGQVVEALSMIGLERVMELVLARKREIKRRWRLDG